VTALIHELIVHAYTSRATDLHLGSSSVGPWVRERVDGALADVAASSKFIRAHREVFFAIKQMAKLEAGEQGVPQQGRFGFDLDGIRLDVRVSALPAAEGESLAIRLKEASRILPLDQLGLLDAQAQQLATLLSKPAGLILVTGPAGSGKTTTLYTCLAKVNTGRVNVITVEDQVEQVLPGLTQIPVQTRTGLTFADGLRSIADHDPDVVMVGDMGDQETASLTVRTALTGHLVLSTLHTNDASSAITRLLDLGIEPFFLCQTLTGILAQRLVRKLCVACREPSDVEASSLVPLGIAVPKRSGAVRLWRPRGCKRCRQTGYLGRIGVFELLTVDHHVRSLIIKRTSGSQIRQSAISRGMVSLAQAFWQKVATGDTSLAELSRILPPELR
jgi:type II secretory ATPase GspE/PulE/Tfp pilus assembly ATPase PilB-like protein